MEGNCVLKSLNTYDLESERKLVKENKTIELYNECIEHIQSTNKRNVKKGSYLISSSNIEYTKEVCNDAISLLQKENKNIYGMYHYYDDGISTGYEILLFWGEDAKKEYKKAVLTQKVKTVMISATAIFIVTAIIAGFYLCITQK